MSTSPALSKTRMDQVARLMKKDGDLVQAATPVERYTGGFADYIRRMDPTYIFAPHLVHLINVLEKVESGEITRLMIFMPPQHGKTRTTSELFPAWYMGRNPMNRVISASYGEQYSLYVANKVRDQLESKQWPFTDVEPATRSRARGSWGLRGKRGWYHTSWINGSATGRGANLFIIDDPIKNPQEADSPVYRQRTWDWFMAVAYSRRNNDPIQEAQGLPRKGEAFIDTPTTKRRKAAIIIIQTRWHEDDLAGRLLEQMKANPEAERWEVVSMPAIAEEDDPIGRQPGEALFAAMHPIEDLINVKNNMPDRWWFAMYQQDPSNKKGGTFARSWFNRTYSLNVLPAYEQIIQVCDSAWKKGPETSFSVIATWGRTSYSYDVLDVWRKRVGYSDLLDALRDNYWMWYPYGCNELYIEDAASGISAIQTLGEEDDDPRGFINVIPFSVAGVQQFYFVETATPFFKAGRVRVPEFAPWKAEWIREHTEYPTSARDDQPVTTAMALRVLGGGSASRSPSGIDWSTFGRLSSAKREVEDSEAEVVDTFSNFGGRVRRPA